MAPLPRSSRHRRARLRAALLTAHSLMATTTVDRPPALRDVRSPSVLVVLVTRDAAGWLRECLESLAAQTYPAPGRPRGRQRLHRRLARAPRARRSVEARVVALDENRGVAGAVQRGASSSAPAPGRRLPLAAARRHGARARRRRRGWSRPPSGIEGVERVGVVGPKIVDWDEPRVLREVGRSTDRFGHPYTPLQDGELDQGQYDRVLEVLFVSSCAMLVSREAWQRTGLFDERFAGHHDDLDFCWRARLAGFRVLMTPLATRPPPGRDRRGERPRGAPPEHAATTPSARRSPRCSRTTAS